MIQNTHKTCKIISTFNYCNNIFILFFFSTNEKCISIVSFVTVYWYCPILLIINNDKYVNPNIENAAGPLLDNIFLY